MLANFDMVETKVMHAFLGLAKVQMLKKAIGQAEVLINDEDGKTVSFAPAIVAGQWLS